MIKKLTKVVLLFILLLISIYFISRILTRKSANSYDIWDNFYDFKPNTLDVIIIGSSHAHMTFNPLIINEQLDIDTYDLSTNRQLIEHSYYMMKEMFKLQSPKIVVLEMFSLADDLDYINTHNAFDDMRLSWNKFRAISDITSKENYKKKKGSKDESKLEYIIPLIRHHLNWKNSDIDNYIADIIINKSYTDNYGYNISNGILSPIEDDYYITPDKLYKETKIIQSERLELLSKIHKLCEDNNAKLIFVAAPYSSRINGKKDFDYNTQYEYLLDLDDFCNSKNIDLINYNLITNELGLDKTYMSDIGHLNIGGATKVTDHISNYIKVNYGELIKECKWEYKSVSIKKYKEFLIEKNRFDIKRKAVLNEQQLNVANHKNNFVEYIKTIDSESHIVIFSAKNNSPKYIDNNINTYTKLLGLNFNIQNNKTNNYVAIKNGKDILLELDSNNTIEFINNDQAIKQLKLPFTLDIISSGLNTGSISMIKINDKEYSVNKDGINIVVYDKVLKKVVSQANFNLNENKQHYFDREKAPCKYDENKVIYTFDIKSKVKGLLGASGSEVLDYGVMLHSNSEDIRFNLNDFQTESHHLLLKAEILCPKAVWFEVYFDGLMEREQLVTGENTIFIEIKLDNPIKNIRIDPANSKGNFLIKGIEICNLSN